MADIYLSSLDVPKKQRNNRAYSGGVSIQKGSDVTNNYNQTHVESGVWEYDNGDFADHEVTIFFNIPFSDIPFWDIKVYRMSQQGSVWMIEDVYFGFASESSWLTTASCVINIADYESLDGVIAKFFFTDRTINI